MPHGVLEVPVSIEFEGTPCVCTAESDGVVYRPYNLDDRIPIAPQADAWEVRESFYSVSTSAEALEFVKTYGLFQVQRMQGKWLFQDIAKWQQAFRWLLVKRPAKWGYLATSRLPFRFRSSKYGWLVDFGAIGGFGEEIANMIAATRKFEVQFSWVKKPGLKGTQKSQHAAVILTKDVFHAILATIYVDHLRQAEYGFCARLDCGKSFEKLSGHERKYCTDTCSHTEWTRLNRRRKKEEQQKQTA